MASEIVSKYQSYFTMDEAVPYKLACGHTIEIKPVNVKDSLIFLSSCGILDIDKNQSNNVEDIQMSYLQYLATRVLIGDTTKQQLVNICLLCLGFTYPVLRYDDNKKIVLCNYIVEDEEKIKEEFVVKAKEFEEIRKIILYQNLIGYDDDYVDPELKKNMQELDEIKTRDIDTPSLERRMAIITCHCGISKDEQKKMTYRSHTFLFNEVCGEVRHLSLMALASYGGNGDDVEWIFRKKKDKYSEYTTSVESYNKSMGGTGEITSTTII